MLTELGLRNFKAFGDVEQKAPMSKITLIYGPNSSGKSSIIQALLLLKQQRFHAPRPSRIRHILMPNRIFTKLGSYAALIHKHEENRTLGIRCVFVCENEPLETEVNMMFVKDQPDNNQGVISELIYKITTIGDMSTHQVNLGRKEGSWNIRESSIGGIEIDHDSSSSVLPAIVPLGSLDEEDTDLPFSSMRRLLRRESENLEARLQQEQERKTEYEFMLTASRFSGELRRVRYLAPLRSHPERLYDIHTGENALSLTGANTPVILYHNQEILKKVNRWFKEFEIQLTLKIGRFGNDSLTGKRFALVMTDVNTNTPVTIADVGFGVNQILPIIVEGVTLSNRRGGILCVEQPEIHIHPRLQAHLADLMIESTRTEKDTDTPNQWIVETHSELLILRLQRRIREGRLNPSDISVLYVSPQSGEGATIQQLRLDEEGDFIDHWPDGFFEEGFNELMA